jgi:hypothetical protein
MRAHHTFDSGLALGQWETWQDQDIELPPTGYGRTRMIHVMWKHSPVKQMMTALVLWRRFSKLRENYNFELTGQRASYVPRLEYSISS